MPIRPIDIRRKEFSNGLRGYEPNQVDDFLDAVADEFERNYTENQRLREEVSNLRHRLQKFEDLKRSIEEAALAHAEQAANDLRRAATQEAESTVREARARSHQILADSSARIERVQESYEALQEAKRSFANDFRHLLKTYTEMIENMEVATAREIEASLRERLDTESIAVVREAAAEEEAIDTVEAIIAEGASEEGAASDAERALPEQEDIEPGEEPGSADEGVAEDPGVNRQHEPEADGAIEASGAPPSIALQDPAADTQDHLSDRSVLALAEGIELVGEYKGSGSSEAQYLVRRADGQFVYLSRLLYLVAEAIDGRRDLEQIADRVSEAFGHGVTADNVRYLAEKKLAPLGVLATPETFEPPRYKQSVVGFNYRLGVVPAGVVRAITTPFLPFFWPPVVAAVLCGLVALDVWIVFVHGVRQGVLDVIYQPSLTFLLVGGELLAMAWHECGHATACRYGGAKPGRVGVGIYVIWFVFFCDVTDSYRLDKVGRLRTDSGGLYFDAVFTLALAGAYFFTGFEPLLALILFNQIAALDELSPFLRLDGYYILSDLTGVPDLFKYIRPVVMSLIPGREADESVKALKPWVRAVVTVWVLAVVPILLFGFAMLIYYGPSFIAAAWDSFSIHYGEVSDAFRGGRIFDGILGVANVVGLLIPVVGGILLVAWVYKLLLVAAWRWLREGARRVARRWAPETGRASDAGGSVESLQQVVGRARFGGHPQAEHREDATRLSWLGSRSRYAVYVAGALFALVGLGAGVWFVTGEQSEHNRAGSGGSAGLGTMEDTATETTSTAVSESTAGESTNPEDTAGETDGKSTNPEEPAKEYPFLHVATDENSDGDFTYIDDPAIDGDPNAVVLVAASAEQEVTGGARYGHNIGVWYESSAQKWAIFNQDQTAVPTGATFRITVPPASKGFVHRAEIANIVGNATYLYDPRTIGEPGADLSVTQNWNPGGGSGIYNDHPIVVFYDKDVDKWAIYNRDGAPMPEGAAFNVAITGREESAR